MAAARRLEPLHLAALSFCSVHSTRPPAFPSPSPALACPPPRAPPLSRSPFPPSFRHFWLLCSVPLAHVRSTHPPSIPSLPHTPPPPPFLTPPSPPHLLISRLLPTACLLPPPVVVVWPLPRPLALGHHHPGQPVPVLFLPLPCRTAHGPLSCWALPEPCQGRLVLKQLQRRLPCPFTRKPFPRDRRALLRRPQSGRPPAGLPGIRRPSQLPSRRQIATVHLPPRSPTRFCMPARCPPARRHALWPPAPSVAFLILPPLTKQPADRRSRRARNGLACPHLKTHGRPAPRTPQCLQAQMSSPGLI